MFLHRIRVYNKRIVGKLDIIGRSQLAILCATNELLDCVQRLAAGQKTSDFDVIDCEKGVNETLHEKHIRVAERLNGYVAWPAMTMAAVSGQSLFAWEQSRVTETFPPMIPILLFVNIMTSMSALSLSNQVADRITDLKSLISNQEDVTEKSVHMTREKSVHPTLSKFEYLCLFTPIFFTLLATTSLLICLFSLIFATEAIRSGIVASALCAPVLLWTMLLKFRLGYLSIR